MNSSPHTSTNQAPSGNFAVIYEQYAPALYGYICKTVKDPGQSTQILQTVFANASNQWESYDAVNNSIFTWLVRIAEQYLSSYKREQALKQLFLCQGINC